MSSGRTPARLSHTKPASVGKSVTGSMTIFLTPMASPLVNQCYTMVLRANYGLSPPMANSFCYSGCCILLRWDRCLRIWFYCLWAITSGKPIEHAGYFLTASSTTRIIFWIFCRSLKCLFFSNDGNTIGDLYLFNMIYLFWFEIIVFFLIA